MEQTRCVGVGGFGVSQCLSLMRCSYCGSVALKNLSSVSLYKFCPEAPASGEKKKSNWTDDIVYWLHTLYPLPVFVPFIAQPNYFHLCCSPVALECVIMLFSSVSSKHASAPDI